MNAVDSETWRCRGCGGSFIGHRTPDDLCNDCISFRLASPAQLIEGADPRDAEYIGGYRPGLDDA